MWGSQRDAQEQTQQEPRTAANARTVWEIIDRINSEHEAEGRPSPVLEHLAPRGEITVDHARVLMQRHRVCNREECPAKRAAFALLVERGIMVPSPANGQLAPGRI